MNIQTASPSNPLARSFARPVPVQATSRDLYVASSSGRGSSLPFLGMGLVTGAVGVGVPGALGMGAIKSFAGGHLLLGAGLAAACLGVGAVTVPISLMGAAMSTDGGGQAGFYGYLAGAGLALAGAGLAIF